MGKERDDVDKKLLTSLGEGPANQKMLAEAAKCHVKTARLHLTDMERDGLIESKDFGNMILYYLKGQKHWQKHWKLSGKKRKRR